MNIGVNIMKNLSFKENKFLEFIPLHTHDYDAVLVRNVSNKALSETYQLRMDSIEFHDSVMRIGRLREELEEMHEYGRKVCPRSEYIRISDASIIKTTENLT